MRFSAAGPTVLATGLFAAVTLVASACANHPPVEQAATVAPKSPPTAEPVPPDPGVGAVFLGGGWLHTCTGAVLNSAAGDLILTAAHCLAGGVDATFVAGLNDAADPRTSGTSMPSIWTRDGCRTRIRWLTSPSRG